MSDFIFREQPKNILEFVGDFEGYYQAETDPWGQSGTDGELAEYYQASRKRLVEALQHEADAYGFGPGLEIGCGHGHLTNLLADKLQVEMAGVDISKTAISSARLRYPQHTFYVRDITADNFGIPVPSQSFGFAVLSQCLWYVLHALNVTVTNMLNELAPGGFLVVTQAFLRDQRYGNEIVSGFQGATAAFLQRFPSELRLIHAHYDDTDRFKHHDGLLIFRKVSNADASYGAEPGAKEALG